MPVSVGRELTLQHMSYPVQGSREASPPDGGAVTGHAEPPKDSALVRQRVVCRTLRHQPVGVPDPACRCAG